MVGVGDGGAPDQHRGAGEGLVQMGDDPAGRGGRGLGGAGHGDGQQVGHAGQRLGQRIGRGVRTRARSTLKPAQRSRSAAMATGAECCSAGGVVMTTLPRFGPRRANRAPMREMSRTATALARCSSATVSSPACQRSPMDSRAGVTSWRSTWEGEWSEARAASSTAQAPGSSPASNRASSWAWVAAVRAAGFAGRPGTPASSGPGHRGRPANRPPRGWQGACRCGRSGRRSCSARPTCPPPAAGSTAFRHPCAFDSGPQLPEFSSKSASGGKQCRGPDAGSSSTMTRAVELRLPSDRSGGQAGPPRRHSQSRGRWHRLVGPTP